MSNTITIELSQEDRARLDAILAALEKGHSCEGCVKAAFDYADHLKSLGDADPEKPLPVEEVKPEPEAPAEPEPVAPANEAPTVDRADVQRKVVALSAAGKKDAVKEIVLAYGNTKVSDIPEDKLAEVLAKLTALEG